MLITTGAYIEIVPGDLRRLPGLNSEFLKSHTLTEYALKLTLRVGSRTRPWLYKDVFNGKRISSVLERNCPTALGRRRNIHWCWLHRGVLLGVSPERKN